MTAAAFAAVLARSDRREPDACWPWLGGLCTKGYGQISIAGRAHMVHRVAYEAERGPIPRGLVIDHLCHDPADCPGGVQCPHRRCVNPAHLAAVTNADNLRRQSPAAKTHCERGHELAGENLGRHSSTGRRYCITCSRAQSRAWRYVRRTVAPAEIRAWAVPRGLAKPGKGSLSKAAIAAWDAAHPDRPYQALPPGASVPLRNAA